MEPKDIFVSFAAVLVVILAALYFMNDLSDTYGVSDVGSSFNNTMTSTRILQNLTDLSGTAGSGLETDEGGGITDVDQNILSKGLRVFRILGRLVGLGEDLMQDAAVILGIPQIYVQIGSIVFLFVFSVTILYILILGVRRILP